MYFPIIRTAIIVMSICLLIVYINPLKWEAGVFQFLKEEKVNYIQTYIGVIDRVVNDKVVILLESEEREMVVHRTELPNDCGSGTWLLINVYSDETYNISVQYDLTEKNRQQSNVLINKLYK